MTTLLDERLESVAADVDALGRPVMLFGAGVLHRYLDVPEVLADPLRPTEDVDALVQLSAGPTEAASAGAFEASLRQRGWKTWRS